MMMIIIITIQSSDQFQTHSSHKHSPINTRITWCAFADKLCFCSVTFSSPRHLHLTFLNILLSFVFVLCLYISLPFPVLLHCSQPAIVTQQSNGPLSCSGQPHNSTVQSPAPDIPTIQLSTLLLRTAQQFNGSISCTGHSHNLTVQSPAPGQPHNSTVHSLAPDNPTIQLSNLLLSDSPTIQLSTLLLRTVPQFNCPLSCTRTAPQFNCPRSCSGQSHNSTVHSPAPGQSHNSTVHALAPDSPTIQRSTPLLRRAPHSILTPAVAEHSG